MRRALAPLLALVATPAAAQEGPEWAGVWEGRVGTYPVRLCIDAWGDQPARGAYYYLSQLEPIALSEGDGEGGWIERAPDGEQQALWEFAEQTGERLRGTWRQGRRSLPFDLEPMAWTEGEWGGPCSSAAFLGPRNGAPKLLSGEAQLDGWAYSPQSYVPAPSFAGDVGIETFAFAPEQPGDAAILAKLAAHLPRGTADDAFLQCLGGAIAAVGTDGMFVETLRPTLVSSAFLAVEETSETYCGGAHPNYYTVTHTYDRQSGEEVQLARWLGETAIEHRTYEGDSEGYDLVRPALRELILSRGVSDSEPVEGEDESYEAECREAAREQEFWTFGLSREGMLFVPSLPHVIAACQATYTVPWGELAPFLSETGRAGLARLRGE